MGAEVQVGIRPEDMMETDAENYAYHGKVEITEALGEVTLLYFEASSPEHAPVIGKLTGIHKELRGKDVRLTAEPQNVHVFKDGISLLYRDQDVFVPGVQPH
jgi:alpha-glucoside transport system ATP-binding protein